MATLTSAQRADMQGDLGIGADQSVFTNDELDRLYTRAEGSYALAVYYGYRQLLASANKFHDYTRGLTRVARSQMRDNLAASVEFWKEEARNTSNQVQIVGARLIPPKNKRKPSA